MAVSFITLSQLQQAIRQTLCGAFTSPVWITAEIEEMKVNARSGHCYLQLVEKGGDKTTIELRNVKKNGDVNSSLFVVGK